MSSLSVGSPDAAKLRRSESAPSSTQAATTTESPIDCKSQSRNAAEISNGNIGTGQGSGAMKQIFQGGTGTISKTASPHTPSRDHTGFSGRKRDRSDDYLTGQSSMPRLADRSECVRSELDWIQGRATVFISRASLEKLGSTGLGRRIVVRACPSGGRGSGAIRSLAASLRGQSLLEQQLAFTCIQVPPRAPSCDAPAAGR